MKKIISIVLILVMLLGCMPASAFAVEEDCGVYFSEKRYDWGTVYLDGSGQVLTKSATIINTNDYPVFVGINSYSRSLILNDFLKVKGENVSGGTAYADPGAELAPGEEYTFSILINLADLENIYSSPQNYSVKFFVWDKRPITVTETGAYYETVTTINGAKGLGTIYLDAYLSFEYGEELQNDFVVDADALQFGDIVIDDENFSLNNYLDSFDRQSFSATLKLTNNSQNRLYLGGAYYTSDTGYISINVAETKKLEIAPGATIEVPVTLSFNHFTAFSGNLAISYSYTQYNRNMAKANINVSGNIITSKGLPVVVYKDNITESIDIWDRADLYGTDSSKEYAIFFVEPGDSISFTFIPAKDDQQILDWYSSSFMCDDHSINKNVVSLSNITGPCKVHTQWRYGTLGIEKKNEAKTVFTDVPAGSYYEDAIKWAYDNEVTMGVSTTAFGPASTCTRGQVVTFLWRANGCPEPKTKKNPFADVKSSDYFYKAVLWAVEKGITVGTSATTFSPESTCNNSQIITFIYRAVGEPGKTNNPETWYTDSVNWANKQHLLDGTYTGTFDPNADCPRCNTVYYLYKYAVK